MQIEWVVVVVVVSNDDLFKKVLVWFHWQKKGTARSGVEKWWLVFLKKWWTAWWKDQGLVSVAFWDSNDCNTQLCLSRILSKLCVFPNGHWRAQTEECIVRQAPSTDTVFLQKQQSGMFKHPLLFKTCCVRTMG